MAEDIDTAIERWQAAGERILVSRAAREQRLEAVEAFRRVDAALRADRGAPAELEDFACTRRPAPNCPDAFALELYGVSLGVLSRHLDGPSGWAFHPAGPVAGHDRESVAVGIPTPTLDGEVETGCEAEQIAHARNDAAAICLARLLESPFR
ncbi:MAG: hypothetical protein ACYCXW_09635 [Solirubrobacteraceae bacterium]